MRLRVVQWSWRENFRTIIPIDCLWFKAYVSTKTCLSLTYLMAPLHSETNSRSHIAEDIAQESEDLQQYNFKGKCDVEKGFETTASRFWCLQSIQRSTLWNIFKGRQWFCITFWGWDNKKRLRMRSTDCSARVDREDLNHHVIPGSWWINCTGQMWINL